jgi:hypothetical protein
MISLLWVALWVGSPPLPSRLNKLSHYCLAWTLEGFSWDLRSSRRWHLAGSHLPCYSKTIGYAPFDILVRHMFSC